VGNWTQIGFGGGPFGRTHNRSNEITDVFTGFSDYDPTYDENGNTTYIALPTSEERTFTYDAWNRLREVKVSGVPILSYVYDALGRRIRETAGSGEEYYYGAGWQVLSERDGPTSSDDTLREYVWGLQYIDEILARDEDKTGDGDTRDAGDETIYYVQDANWNVRTLLDDSGSAVGRVLYDPYGLPSFLEGDWDTLSSSAYGNRVLFTGRLWNPTSLTYDYRNREYSPYLGRFLQRDPIGIWGDEANAGRGYGYAGSGPIGSTDPFGDLTCTATATVTSFVRPTGEYLDNPAAAVADIMGAVRSQDPIRIALEYTRYHETVYTCSCKVECDDSCPEGTL